MVGGAFEPHLVQRSCSSKSMPNTRCERLSSRGPDCNRWRQVNTASNASAASSCHSPLRCKNTSRRERERERERQWQSRAYQIALLELGFGAIESRKGIAQSERRNVRLVRELVLCEDQLQAGRTAIVKNTACDNVVAHARRMW